MWGTQLTTNTRETDKERSKKAEMAGSILRNPHLEDMVLSLPFLFNVFYILHSMCLTVTLLVGRIVFIYIYIVLKDECL